MRFIIHLMLLGAMAAMPAAAHAWSLEKELELGREEHQKIIGSMGVYRDSELQAYVNRVGQRIAKHASRQELEYTFTVLNHEMINALALPGGYIYITRGLLANMNSEAELAAVLGHEIAHVTEKHAERRERRSTGLKAANVLLAGVTGQAGLYELGNIFGGVLLSGYSREFELEADQVGAELIAKAGYSPRAMIDTIEILKANDRIEIEQARLEEREPRVYHGFLSSHPDHDTRYEQAILEAERLLTDAAEFIGAEEFLKKLNGLAYGSSRQVGVVRQNRFYYPRHGIKFTFPKSWRFESGTRSLQAVSQTGDAVFTVSTAAVGKAKSPREFAVDVAGLNVREGREITIGDMPAFIGIADRSDTQFGPRPVRFAVVIDPRKRLGYILRGAGKYDLHRVKDDKAFIATIFSFDRMDAEDFKVAKRPRLQVVRAEEGTTIEKLAETTAIGNYAIDRLRVMNGLYPHGQPTPGQLIKTVE